jgi:hypothetical protein
MRPFSKEDLSLSDIYEFHEVRLFLDGTVLFSVPHMGPFSSIRLLSRPPIFLIPSRVFFAQQILHVALYKETNTNKYKTNTKQIQNKNKTKTNQKWCDYGLKDETHRIFYYSTIS